MWRLNWATSWVAFKDYARILRTSSRTAINDSLCFFFFFFFFVFSIIMTHCRYYFKFFYVTFVFIKEKNHNDKKNYVYHNKFKSDIFRSSNILFIFSYICIKMSKNWLSIIKKKFFFRNVLFEGALGKKNKKKKKYIFRGRNFFEIIFWNVLFEGAILR